MPSKPEALDYEGVFPIRRRHAEQSGAQVEEWPARPQAEASADEEFTAKTDRAAVIGIGSARQIDAFEILSRRGHSLSYFWLFVFSVVLYVRPYEFFPGLSSLTQMAFYTGLVTLIVYAVSQLGLEGNLTARPREINMVLLLGLAALLSMPMAVDPGEAWKVFNDMLLKTIIIFIVFVNVVRTEMRLRLLLLLILAVSIYLSVSAINDYRHGVFVVGAIENHNLRIAGRIKGLFENSNDLALHLVSMIPIAIALALYKRGLPRKLVYFGAVGIMVAAVVVTFSRGGFIGLVAAALILVRRLGRKNRVATTGALVFAVLIFMAAAPGAYSGRLATVFNSAADVTGSSSQRTEVLKRSIWVTLRYPLFGVGIGNFHHKSPRELETHNAYTQVSSEMGIWAFVVYLIFLIYPLRRLRLIENQSYEKPEQRRFYYLAIGLQGALVGYMVASFFGPVAYQWYVYYLVGYAVCLHRIYLVKFPPQEGYKPGFWEHPFAKEKKEEVSSGAALPVSQPSHS
ncbi:MAG TPA: O-antigen ligase family protein [Pyrinomonadaceae bacterium]